MSVTNQVYKDAGVNLDAGNALSRFAAETLSETYNNCPYIEVHDRAQGNFRGSRTYGFVDTPQGWEVLPGADGIGTKTMVHAAALTAEQSGFDLVAMVTGDATREGACPAVFTNTLNVSSLGEVGSPSFGFAEDLFRGLAQALNVAGVVGLKGEIAELGLGVGSEIDDAVLKFNWDGTLTAISHPQLRITGETIRPGDRIIAFEEKSGRSNGYSFYRRSAAYEFGERWWHNEKARLWLAAVSRPSTIYDRFLTIANGWFTKSFTNRIPLKGIAHISGGGIGEKLGGVLFPTGHSAELYNLFEVPGFMRQAADWHSKVKYVDDRTFYRTVHGGQGVLLICAPEDEERTIEAALRFGHRAQLAGIVVASGSSPAIRIHSKYRGEIVDEFPGVA